MQLEVDKIQPFWEAVDRMRNGKSCGWCWQIFLGRAQVRDWPSVILYTFTVPLNRRCSNLLLLCLKCEGCFWLGRHKLRSVRALWKEWGPPTLSYPHLAAEVHLSSCGCPFWFHDVNRKRKRWNGEEIFTRKIALHIVKYGEGRWEIRGKNKIQFF